MAILADVFVSTPADAQRYQSLQPKRSGGPFELVQFKGLTDLEFGMLWAIIDSEDFDFDRHTLESLSHRDETWLFRFPTAFVQKLAALTPATIDEVSAAWADTEELQWEPSRAKEVVVELARLGQTRFVAFEGVVLLGFTLASSHVFPMQYR